MSWGRAAVEVSQKDHFQIPAQDLLHVQAHHAGAGQRVLPGGGVGAADELDVEVVVGVGGGNLEPAGETVEVENAGARGGSGLPPVL